MRPRDIALAVAVAAAWGFNFVAIKAGLDRMPPLLFCALRFALATLPAIFFVGRPRVAWRWIIAVGVALGVVKFSLLFAGMSAGMPAGLSSLVLQSQAIFTVVFAVALLKERPRWTQLAGLTVAASGIALVASRLGTDRPAAAFALVIASAAAWGLANVGMRKAAPADMLRFMVWVSAVATLPLFGLSFLLEGPARMSEALQAIDSTAIVSLIYIAAISTLAGFAAWGALIRRYGAATVAPFSMLVPFFGMGSAAFFLGEQLHPVDLIAGVLVVTGVLLPQLFTRTRTRATPVPPAGAVPPSREPVGSLESSSAAGTLRPHQPVGSLESSSAAGTLRPHEPVGRLEPSSAASTLPSREPVSAVAGRAAGPGTVGA